MDLQARQAELGRHIERLNGAIAGREHELELLRRERERSIGAIEEIGRLLQPEEQGPEAEPAP